MHGYKYFFFDHTPARLAQAKASIDTAVRLAPDAPETIMNLGYFHYFCLRDFARALELFEQSARMQPNDEGMRFAVAPPQSGGQRAPLKNRLYCFPPHFA